MAGTLAAGAWDRDTCDPFDEHSGPADAPASKERPARHRTSEAELPWLAARRAWALHDGAGADAVGGGRAAAEPGAFEPDRRADTGPTPLEVDAGPLRGACLHSEKRKAGGQGK